MGKGNKKIKSNNDPIRARKAALKDESETEDLLSGFIKLQAVIMPQF